VPLLSQRPRKLAEKFHTTPETILALNDPNAPLGAGAVVRLPNVLPRLRSYGDVKPDAAQMLSDLNVSGDLPKADQIVVDKSDGVLRLFTEDGRLLAQFPATMAVPTIHCRWASGGDRNRLQSALPLSARTLLGCGRQQGRTEATTRSQRPGRTVWIDLSKDHYGIHGTSEPQTIQRAQSHGCIRLTNWDAARVAQMVKPGMEVIFQA